MMRVIPPLAITPAMLQSSTAIEPAANEIPWAAGTNYAIGQIVYRATTRHLYEALSAGVDAGLPEATPTRWKDRGACNKWAMFDYKRNLRTTVTGPLTVTIVPGQGLDALALLDMSATSATITITSDGQVVFSKTERLYFRTVRNMYEYISTPFSTKQNLVYFKLPKVPNRVITVTLTHASGTVSCGGMIMGLAEEIGNVQYEAERQFMNFGRVVRDASGNAELFPAASVPKTINQLFVDKKRLARIYQLFDKINGVPAVWCGLDSADDPYFDSLLIMGIYTDVKMNLKYPDHALCSLNLEAI